MHCHVYWPCDILVWCFSKEVAVWFQADQGCAGMTYCPLTVFKSRLKTHLFHLAHNDRQWLMWPPPPPPLKLRPYGGVEMCVLLLLLLLWSQWSHVQFALVSTVKVFSCMKFTAQSSYFATRCIIVISNYRLPHYRPAEGRVHDTTMLRPGSAITFHSHVLVVSTSCWSARPGGQYVVPADSNTRHQRQKSVTGRQRRGISVSTVVGIWYYNHSVQQERGFVFQSTPELLRVLCPFTFVMQIFTGNIPMKSSWCHKRHFYNNSGQF